MGGSVNMIPVVNSSISLSNLKQKNCLKNLHVIERRLDGGRGNILRERQIGRQIGQEKESRKIHFKVLGVFQLDESIDTVVVITLLGKDTIFF